MKLVVLSWVRNEQYGQNDLNAVQYLYIVWYKNVIVQRLSQTKWSKLNTNQSTFHFENDIKNHVLPWVTSGHDLQQCPQWNYTHKRYRARAAESSQ